ncbi:VanZ family protein [Lactococcus formosensis]|uniref:VanZ family protein n=1 Tax=Lactococcus formosensis TaxID=1281486 RepID=UPI000BBAC87C
MSLFLSLSVFLWATFQNGAFLENGGAIFLVSLFVEILQFIFGIGATDITDIITNTSGGLIGLLLYHAFQKNERRQDVISLFFGGFLLFFTFVLLLH